MDISIYANKQITMFIIYLINMTEYFNSQNLHLAKLLYKQKTCDFSQGPMYPRAVIAWLWLKTFQILYISLPSLRPTNIPQTIVEDDPFLELKWLFQGISSFSVCSCSLEDYWNTQQADHK